MGQALSQTKESPDIKVFLMKNYPNYKIIKILNNGILYKSLLIVKDKAPLVVKIFLKKYYTEGDMKFFLVEKEKYYQILKKISQNSKNLITNIAPIINIEDSPLCCIIFRQYFEFTLKERIYLMPYLNDIEKIWISFQLLFSLNNMRQLNITHGDINTNNILITSNLSIYLTDLASYKPAYISIDDIAKYTYYFGSNDNISLKGFYLAPERLIDKKNFNFNPVEMKLEKKMDVFSLGVIIAELFLEKSLFSFQSMLNYKKGNKDLFNLDEILNDIKNEKIKIMVSNMLKLDPEERIDANRALVYFTLEICPVVMSNFLLQFNIMINYSMFYQPDLVIGFLNKYWTSILKLIYGENENPVAFNQSLNLEIVNQIFLNNPFTSGVMQNLIKKNSDGHFCVNDYIFIINLDIKELIDYREKNNNKEKEEYNKDCCLIIINYLLKNMKNVKYETSNYVAMEMVKNLCTKLPDITKLQTIIPYFVANVKRKCYTTKLISLKNIFDIFYIINFI